MQITFWAATDTGLTRDHNEDNFLVDRKLNLFIVADGMGGHAAGEIASSVAVHKVRAVIAQQREVIENYKSSGSVLLRQTVLTLIERAISVACHEVHRLAQEDEERHGMGTTLSMLLVARGRGFIGHVGDSRVYRTRGQDVLQVTEDHSVINELIKSGRLKPGDEFNSPYKNAVTRAVGVHPSVEVDTFDFTIEEGDNYLLCSDGLSCYLNDQNTLEFLSQEDIKSIPQALIEHANACGGKDNITAIIVRAIETNTEVKVSAPTVAQQPAAPSIPSVPSTAFNIGATHSIQSSIPPPIPALEDSIKTDRFNPHTEPTDTASQTSTAKQLNRNTLSGLPLDLMKLSPLFNFLDDRGMEDFASYATVLNLTPEETVWVEGEENEHLYLLIQGSLAVQKANQNIDVLSVGAVIGESSVLASQICKVSVVAKAESKLLVWDRYAIYGFLSHNHHFAVGFMWGLSQLLHNKSKHIQQQYSIAQEVLQKNSLMTGTNIQHYWALYPSVLPAVIGDSLVPQFIHDLQDKSVNQFNLSIDELIKQGEEWSDEHSEDVFTDN